MKFRILLIEDEPGLVLTIGDRLANEGYAVETAADGLDGLQRATDENFDLILLDVMLPGKNGFDVCRDLRQRKVLTPIIMLTARGQTIDKVLGLKIGADDYLVKPFEMMELLARIEAQLRRPVAALSDFSVDDLPRYRFDTIEVNFRSAEVRRDNQKIELSAREFKLLSYLIEHRGTLLSRERLLNDVWGYNSMVTTRTVDVHVAWLRQKLEPNPRYPQFLLTVHGLGYKFVG